MILHYSVPSTSLNKPFIQTPSRFSRISSQSTLHEITWVLEFQSLLKTFSTHISQTTQPNPNIFAYLSSWEEVESIWAKKVKFGRLRRHLRRETHRRPPWKPQIPARSFKASFFTFFQVFFLSFLPESSYNSFKTFLGKIWALKHMKSW